MWAITNTGAADATNVVFNDTIDPNTTLVPGSVNTQPIAVSDAYNVIGNVRAVIYARASLPDADFVVKLCDGRPAPEQVRVDMVPSLATEAGTIGEALAATILEGLEEILCVVRLGLPQDLRRSLACTNIIENMNGTIRQVTRNVKRWRDASMALRWTAAGMMEAKKGFRRLKAYKQLPKLRDALLALKAARAAALADHSGLANLGEAA